MSKFFEVVLLPILENINSHPGANAFCIGGRYYTYQEFGLRVAAIQGILQSRGTRGNVIGLVANDDLDTYASILAIWLDGSSYVPLHPKQPKERNLNVIAQAGVGLVLDSDFEWSFEVVETIRTSHVQSGLGILSINSASDVDLVYVLFTSGSTGSPKGVPISRLNLASFIVAFRESGIRLSADDRCLQCFDLTFDVSVQAFLAPLIAGACVYTIPHDKIKYVYIYELLMECEITVAVLPPSMIRYLKPYFDEIMVPSMRYCILTAEASPVELVSEWKTRIPRAEIFDFYGPTEATIYCTYYKLPASGVKHVNGLVAIGRPMPGVKAVIVDDHVEVQLGVKGELCIASTQLTQGYWRDETKTGESFITLLKDGEQLRFYRTGDLCMLDADGDLLYLGRKDYQVKIQGYRVELGEIEFHARAILNGANVVAQVYANEIGNSELLLFVEGVGMVDDYLKSELVKRVPKYMIPSRVVVLERFPLNSSDKVDRVKLRAMI